MLYKEEILDLYHHPQNFGHISTRTHSAKGENASCGDEIEIELAIHDGVVKTVGFTNKGCALSTAAASILTEKIKGKDINEINKLSLKDVIREMGEINPGRHKCVLLPLVVIKEAVKDESKITSR